MDKEQKSAAVESIAEQIGAAQAVFVVDYRGISVPDAAELRVRLRDADATFRIVKNSLTERAADKAGAEALRELLVGPTALTFVRGDAALAAKALAEFARTRKPIQFKGGLMDGEPVSVDDIKAIARLPARDVLFAQLVGTVASPLTGLARGLNGLLSGLAIQLQQIVDQGLLGEGASAPDSNGSAEADVPEPEEALAEDTAADEPTEPEPDAPTDERAPGDEPTTGDDGAASPEADVPEPEEALAEGTAADEPNEPEPDSGAEETSQAKEES